MLGRSIYNALSPLLRTSLHDLIVFNTLSSTQTYLLSLPTISRKTWSVAVCELQTSGHGRQQNVWHSSVGQVSFSWRGWLRIQPHQLGLLSLSVSLAVKDALGLFGYRHLQLKWPNDIWCHNQKLAGILVNVIQQKSDCWEVVIGIGINRLSKNIPENAIALEDLSADVPDLSAIIAAVLSTWSQRQVQLQLDNTVKQLRTEWLQHALWLNQPVTIFEQGKQITGLFVGVSETGLLRLLTEQGEQTFSAGDVSCRQAV